MIIINQIVNFSYLSKPYRLFMGSCSIFQRAQKRKAMMIGPFAGGKTTLFYGLLLGKNVLPVPTIGTNIEEIEFD